MGWDESSTEGVKYSVKRREWDIMMRGRELERMIELSGMMVD